MNKNVFFHLGFQTLIKREILRFFRLYKQTLIPSIISSGLYIIIFGHSLGQKIGTITSGSWSPTLNEAIAMAYVPIELKKIGTALEVEIRGTKHEAIVVKRPFYRSIS